MGVEIGVSQGSCLGSQLFFVYIIELPRPVKNSTISMYADDTSLCLKSKDLFEVSQESCLGSQRGSLAPTCLVD